MNYTPAKTRIFMAIGKDGEKLFANRATNVQSFRKQVEFELYYSGKRLQSWHDGGCKVEEQLWSDKE